MVATKDEGRLFSLISFAVATITAVVAAKDEGRVYEDVPCNYSTSTLCSPWFSLKSFGDRREVADSCFKDYAPFQ
ncbi:hypothetical protein LWI29_028040 [Acer saccharum]|uniref:Uncharacterized protein n=1 Tax=Acer saccharum TaxID=4024 RepID=A0AA39VH40_ACESA|nr:hypothetical protein LWI29_028040 [Acer saccharum]